MAFPVIALAKPRRPPVLEILKISLYRKIKVVKFSIDQSSVAVKNNYLFAFFLKRKIAFQINAKTKRSH